MICIVGLGAGSEKHLTLETIEIISDKKRKLYLRTEIHPTVEYLKRESIEYKSFDYLYEKSESFEDIYESLVSELLKLAADKDKVALEYVKLAKEILTSEKGTPRELTKWSWQLIDKVSPRPFDPEDLKNVMNTSTHIFCAIFTMMFGAMASAQA